MKNRNNMSMREYLEYIPTEIENGFLMQTVWNKFDFANIRENELFKTKEELLKSL